MVQQKAPNNRTIELDNEQFLHYHSKALTMNERVFNSETVINKTLIGDVETWFDLMPQDFIDLAIIDPPYNKPKTYNGITFPKMKDEDYKDWVESWLRRLVDYKLKIDASIYVCCDWQTSPIIYDVLKDWLYVRNRITWEREKGRGSKRNWKDCVEDIYFATMSDNYYFNVEAVKHKKRVKAPYKENGNPKGWKQENEGNFRFTHPSNFWGDITVPFWSMPENTPHPTQKPEKLIAKLILASSREDDVVFDPFLGSGTTSVVAKKLGRNYCGVEFDDYYCALSERRLEMAEQDKTIQGYEDGVFWERNSK